MNRPLILFFLIAPFFLSGCVTTLQNSLKDFGGVVKSTVQGDYYLSHKKYQEGEKKFQHALQKDPDSHLNNYLYGRMLLANNKNEKALPYLQKACTLKPDDADYHFWTGVAYGSLNQRKQERQQYEKALSLEKKHLQALLYYGHNLLQAKQYTMALENYNKALKLWPDSPSALYNRALIFSKLDRTPEEKQAWLEYLARYPSGAMARQAVTHLNSLQDFSYRNYRLGARTVSIEKIAFQPFTANLERGSSPSLKLIATIFKNMHKGSLQVIVYQKNNKALAKEKAQAIKKHLLDNNPEITKKDIGTSWFSQPEKITIQGKKLSVDESVAFFISGI
ncbi:MAG: tetratricopeptide repeat protein [Proteobacteria bacterium]|nr:tetratricopeptide repeat protein [Pseudomonadota bacterium]MBU1233150.1 tetratricopeptide repeat protein [Pseudomonadota bacterium]MBU1417251.1 tetratricopeptide repeat protein [Pseudomonadota bacterium]MBU1455422.1 tetratricopeptide repeat protein [Pseudomonadota bacterium]